MRTFVKFILLAEAFAVTTYGLGWWVVPVMAAIWGTVSSGPSKARFAALAAAIGWGTLLILDVTRGPVAVMASQLAGVMKLPAVALYLLTLIFPALLAWCAATLTPTIRKGSAA
jgi:hypothetical protein